jgi:hypothetical protein
MNIFRFIILVSIPFIFWNCDRSNEIVEDPGIPPAVPTGLRIFYASDGEIVIEWRFNSEPDVKGYNIYRRTEFTESEIVGFVSEDFFFDDSLQYDTTYFYKITAVSLWNRESEFSNEVSAKPQNVNNPRRPVGLRINARNWEGETSIYLHWLNNEESDIAGYNIYRGSLPGFISDSTNLIGFTSTANFYDTLSLNFYSRYYYKIKAVDNGGLLSSQSDEVNDLIFEIPEIIFPADNAYTEFFENFIIKTIDVPARYRIGLQTNKFFGEIWNTTINSSVVNDTLAIHFDPPSLQVNKTYYWRISTYSNGNSEPNSISELFSLTFKN